MQGTLLLGASGQLGTAIAGLLDRVIAPTRRELDLTTLTHDRAHQLVVSTGADAIVNCAAYTAVDKAEEEIDAANAVNGTAVGILAEIAAESGIPFVTYSTDYVFNGRCNQPYVESSAPDPINAYGRSKLLGEQLAQEQTPEALVIRSSWLLSATHPNFVRTVLDRTASGKAMMIVDDQFGSPTFVSDLAERSLEAMSIGASGVLHLTNEGTTSWYRLAKTTLDMAGLDPGLITPCSTKEYPTPAIRPSFSVLCSERLEELGLGRLPHWRSSLTSLLDNLQT